MSGWLDRLPAAARHFLFSVAGLAALALLNWAGANYTSWDIPEALVVVFAAVLPVTVAAVTTWTQQYGRGSGEDESTE